MKWLLLLAARAADTRLARRTAALNALRRANLRARAWREVMMTRYSSDRIHVLNEAVVAYAKAVGVAEYCAGEARKQGCV